MIKYLLLCNVAESMLHKIVLESLYADEIHFFTAAKPVHQMICNLNSKIQLSIKLMMDLYH